MLAPGTAPPQYFCFPFPAECRKAAPPSRPSQQKLPRRGRAFGLLFAGEDGHAKSGNSHESNRGGDHIIGAGGGILFGLGLGGVLGGAVDDDDGRCVLILAVTGGVKSELIIGLPFHNISKFDFFPILVLDGRICRNAIPAFGNHIHGSGICALGIAANNELYRIGLLVRAKVQTNILGAGIAILWGNIKFVIGSSNGCSNIPLRNKLKLDRTGAGNLVVGEGNAGEGAEVASLSLVIIGTPVAVGGLELLASVVLV